MRFEQFSWAANWSMVRWLNPCSRTRSTSASRRCACRWVSRRSSKVATIVVLAYYLQYRLARASVTARRAEEEGAEALFRLRATTT